RVEEPAHEQRVGEEQPHVVERRRLRVPERVRVRIEEVRVLLERRDEHDVEGQSREQREDRDGQVERRARGDTSDAPSATCPPGERGGGGRHQITSLRRISRSSTALTPASTGSRNRAMAAPRPRLPPRMPVKKAWLARVWVMFAGPPRVRMKMAIMSEKVK